MSSLPTKVILPVTETLLVASIALSISFFIYGLNILHLTRRARSYKESEPVETKGKPAISVHLPIYNEFYVVRRLVESCIRMAEHYGRELVRISVVDDSDDDTRQEVDRIAREYASRGFLIQVVRRGNRAGFKAGALQAALERTDEEFVAVFDADFAPPPDFLDRTIPYLLTDDRVGFVQCRWTHFNRDYNGITKTIAIGVDAHFLVEQPGRYASGYLMNFNGSAGLLRRKAMEEAGGWHADTLAEDLDLSYRIQLKGYKGIYLRNLRAPSELPPTITSLKRQQGRWARGSLQTARKLSNEILTSSLLSRIQKFEAGIHLTYYLVHPLMVASFLLAVAATLLDVDVIRYAVNVSLPNIRSWEDITRSLTAENLTFFTIAVAPWIIFSILILLSTSSVLFYCIQAVRMQEMSLIRNTQHLILLVILGYGISISNSVHALSGLLSKTTGAFMRTPKYHITKRQDQWRGKRYQIALEKITLLEAAALILAIIATVKSLVSQNLGILPILAVYLLGYGLVFALTLAQSLYPTSNTELIRQASPTK